MIRFGIIGCGNIANKAFLPALQQCSDAVLVAVASRSKAKAEAMTSKFGGVAIEGYNHLLTREDIDAVYISTLNNTHAELTIKAAQANKHILCEKPMAIKYEDVIKVFKQLKKSKVFFFEALAYSLHPQINSIISVIKSGEIGKIEKIKSYFGFRLRKNLRKTLWSRD